MMLGEKSLSVGYWKQCGNETLKNSIKGVVIMVRYYNFLVSRQFELTAGGSMQGAHWDCCYDEMQVAMNLNLKKSPVVYVHPSKYVDY